MFNGQPTPSYIFRRSGLIPCTRDEDGIDLVPRRVSGNLFFDTFFRAIMAYTPPPPPRIILLRYNIFIATLELFHCSFFRNRVSIFIQIRYIYTHTHEYALYIIHAR